MADSETRLWSLTAPLADDGDPTEADSAISTDLAHDHEFRTVAGSAAWVSRALDATIRVAHEDWPDSGWVDSGTVSVWISPLEDIGSREATSNPDFDGDSTFLLPVFSDTYPWRNLEDSSLGLIVWPQFHPGLMAKCVSGKKGYLAEEATPTEELLRAQTHLDHFDLREGYWYHLALSWDSEAERLELYVNGELALEAPEFAEDRIFERPGKALYVGNPFLAVADLRISDQCLEPEAIETTYATERHRNERPIDPAVDELLYGSERSTFNAESGDYTCQTAMSLTEPEHVAQWTPHGPDNTTLAALEATPEGMLFETRDTWDVDNLCTLWGPESYEGDLFLQYDFRVERDSGLALVTFNASTLSRQDVLEDRNYPVTGSMQTILSNVRNYWWEYMRRTPPVRHDVSTQILAKGPHNAPALGAEITDVPTVDTWHTLTVTKDGDRIRCGIDDELVFDVTDSAFSGQGGSYNVGRIGLRHMQKTRVRYRNLAVYTRDRLAEPGTAG